MLKAKYAVEFVRTTLRIIKHFVSNYKD